MAEYRNIHKFQFHIGAIRIGQKSANATILTTFQFHIGAIRISTVSHVPDLVGEFQFHIGAIRIYRDRRNMSTKMSRFFKKINLFYPDSERLPGELSNV